MLALQKFREYGSELGNVRAWLLKLSYNVCMDMHRERRRRREDSLDDAGAVLSAASSGGDPEQRYLDIERRARLEQWVGELPARLRGPMTLYLHRHMRYREIARDLGITEVNVRKRRQEARDILRERFRSSQ